MRTRLRPRLKRHRPRARICRRAADSNVLPRLRPIIVSASKAQRVRSSSSRTQLSDRSGVDAATRRSRAGRPRAWSPARSRRSANGERHPPVLLGLTTPRGVVYFRGSGAPGPRGSGTPGFGSPGVPSVTAGAGRRRTRARRRAAPSAIRKMPERPPPGNTTANNPPTTQTSWNRVSNRARQAPRRRRRRVCRRLSTRAARLRTPAAITRRGNHDRGASVRARREHRAECSGRRARLRGSTPSHVRRRRRRREDRAETRTDRAHHRRQPRRSTRGSPHVFQHERREEREEADDAPRVENPSRYRPRERSRVPGARGALPRPSRTRASPHAARQIDAASIPSRKITDPALSTHEARTRAGAATRLPARRRSRR